MLTYITTKQMLRRWGSSSESYKSVGNHTTAKDALLTAIYDNLEIDRCPKIFKTSNMQGGCITNKHSDQLVLCHRSLSGKRFGTSSIFHTLNYTKWMSSSAVISKETETWTAEQGSSRGWTKRRNTCAWSWRCFYVKNIQVICEVQ